LRFLCLAALSLATCLHADLDSAKALYMDGMKLQAQKDYQGAIAKFQECLKAAPNYVYAYKQMGTCQYYLGDRSAALTDYLKYETAIPSDAPTQAFITRLQDAGVKPNEEVGGTTALPSYTEVESYKEGISLGLELGYNTYGMSSFNTYINNQNSAVAVYGAGSSGGTINGGGEIGLLGAYAIGPSMRLGIDIDYLFASSQDVTSLSGPGGSFTETETFDFPLLWVGPEFDYAFYRSKALRLRGQLGVGYYMLSGAGGTLNGSGTGYVTETVSGTETDTGSGWGFKVGPGMDWAFNQNCFISLDLQYRMATIGAINYTQSETINGVTSSMSGVHTTSGAPGAPNITLDYSGIHFQLAFAYVF
jgi:hypothetical protein